MPSEEEAVIEWDTPPNDADVDLHRDEDEGEDGEALQLSEQDCANDRAALQLLSEHPSGPACDAVAIQKSTVVFFFKGHVITFIQLVRD